MTITHSATATPGGRIAVDAPVHPTTARAAWRGPFCVAHPVTGKKASPPNR